MFQTVYENVWVVDSLTVLMNLIKTQTSFGQQKFCPSRAMSPREKEHIGHGGPNPTDRHGSQGDGVQTAQNHTADQHVEISTGWGQRQWNSQLGDLFQLKQHASCQTLPFTQHLLVTVIRHGMQHGGRGCCGVKQQNGWKWQNFWTLLMFFFVSCHIMSHTWFFLDPKKNGIFQTCLATFMPSPHHLDSPHLVGVSSSTHSARTKQGAGHSWMSRGQPELHKNPRWKNPSPNHCHQITAWDFWPRNDQIHGIISPPEEQSAAAHRGAGCPTWLGRPGVQQHGHKKECPAQ